MPAEVRAELDDMLARAARLLLEVSFATYPQLHTAKVREAEAIVRNVMVVLEAAEKSGCTGTATLRDSACDLVDQLAGNYSEVKHEAATREG